MIEMYGMENDVFGAINLTVVMAAFSGNFPAGEEEVTAEETPTEVATIADAASSQSRREQVANGGSWVIGVQSISW